MLKNASDKVHVLKWDGVEKPVNPGAVFEITDLFDVKKTEVPSLESRFIGKFKGLIVQADEKAAKTAGKAIVNSSAAGDDSKGQTASTELESLSKEQLLELAKTNGLDLDTKTSKAKIIEAITAKIAEE